MAFRKLRSHHRVIDAPLVGRWLHNPRNFVYKNEQFSLHFWMEIRETEFVCRFVIQPEESFLGVDQSSFYGDLRKCFEHL